MGIPVLYAHWEGFVKQSLTYYLEFLEELSLNPQDASPQILSFALRKQLKTLSGNQGLDKLVNFVDQLHETYSSPLVFSDREIDTKSNLNWKNFEYLCNRLSLDVSSLADQGKKLSALVHLRNSIAHGGREPKYKYAFFEVQANFTIELMERFEDRLGACVTGGRYCRINTH